MNNIDVSTHNRALYLAWLRQNFPDLYAEALQSELGGFLDSISNAFSNVVNSVSNALPNLANTYAQYRQQEQLIKMNTDRAKQGLAPLVYSGGQLVDMQGQPYNSQEWNIARTGMSTGSIIMIAAAVGIGILLLMRSGSRR